MNAEPTRLVIGNANDMLRVADELTLLRDRRQNAIEAAYDNPLLSDAARMSVTVRRMIADAIEVATRVKITNEIVQAFTDDPDLWPSIEAPLRDAFRAAGFEVVE